MSHGYCKSEALWWRAVTNIINKFDELFFIIMFHYWLNFTNWSLFSLL